MLKNLKKIRKRKGFTLIELIVTITILAILATIAFISFQGYSQSSRDSKRIADTNSIKKDLGIFVVRSGYYPNPDNGTTIKYIGLTAWTQGTIGDTVTRNIGHINEKPTDPLTNTEYSYSVVNNRREYQIGYILEKGGELSYYIPLLLEQTNALGEKTALAKITGNYNGKILQLSSGSIDYVLAVPTIMTSNLEQTNLETIISNKELVYDGYSNLPASYKDLGYTMTGGFDFSPTNILVFSGSKSTLSDNTKKVDFMTSLKEVYQGTILQGDPSYQDIIKTDGYTNPNASVNLVNNYITTKVLNIIGVQGLTTFRNCSLNGQTIEHGQTIELFSETTIASTADYDCTDKKITRTCNDGILSGDNSYEYLSCEKLIPNNCTANPNYEINGHIYNIPAINHGLTETNIQSTPINITNGTQVYTLTSIECSNGGYININETTNPQVTCDTGFSPSGNSCLAINYTVTFNGNGGSGHNPTTKSVAYNTAVGTLPSNPTNTGYTFNGWFTQSSGGTPVNTSTVITGAITFYAQWTPITFAALPNKTTILNNLNTQLGGSNYTFCSNTFSPNTVLANCGNTNLLYVIRTTGYDYGVYYEELPSNFPSLSGWQANGRGFLFSSVWPSNTLSDSGALQSFSYRQGNITNIQGFTHLHSMYTYGSILYCSNGVWNKGVDILNRSCAVGTTSNSAPSGLTYYVFKGIPIPRGEQLYTTPGTYSWTAPAGITSVSVVCIGGGSGGGYGKGGNGGALAYKNNISVTPGTSYTVVIGAGSLGTSGTSYSSAGGNSYFINTSTVNAGGGAGSQNTTGGAVISGLGGSGGNNGGSWSGGGGAGGYSGNGGNAGYSYSVVPQSGNGGGASGGGSMFINNRGGGGGGATALYGQGTNGVCLNNGPWGTSYGSAGSSGGGGSGGANGSAGGTTDGGNGATPGGGGGAGRYLQSPVTYSKSGNGGNGACRIIRGTGRAFPSTDVGP